MLRQIRNLSSFAFELVFNWHIYFTFERNISCSYAVITVAFDNLFHEFSIQHIDRSKLACSFCSSVKELSNFMSYWNHLIHMHKLTNRFDLLREIKRIAFLWRIYDAKCDKITKTKLKQIEQKEFDWNIVKFWNLKSITNDVFKWNIKYNNNCENDRCFSTNFMMNFRFKTWYRTNKKFLKEKRNTF